MPYLILDIWIGILLAKLVDAKKRKLTLILWFFNPITLYIIYGLSNFDIIPTFFTVLSLYYFQKEKYLFSGLSLGTGIAFKIYPILFLPFFVITLFAKNKINEFAKFLAGSIGIFLISIIFLWKDFLSISNSGLLSKIFEAKLNVGPIHLPLFIIFYLILCATPFIRKTKINISFLILGTTLLMSCTTQIHPQWLIWGLPFLVLLIVEDLKIIFFVIPFLVAYMGSILLYQDTYLTLGIFSPVIPAIYDISTFEQTIFSRINKDFFALLVQTITVLSAIGIAIFSHRNLLWRLYERE